MIYQKLLDLSEKRIHFFTENMNAQGWYRGSKNYFTDLPIEIAEAKLEDRENNHVYLEDELWDVFWDYLMLLQSLKSEWKITSIDAVLEGAYTKFSERSGVDGKWADSDWDIIKTMQKARRNKEHIEKYGTDLHWE